MKVYFDGSGKEDNPQTRFITLAGFAGSDEAWSYFDDEWKGLLADRGNAPYMHMKEAIPHKGVFDGWDADKTNHLIQGLIGLLQEVSVGPTHKFCGFRCTVDIAAHKKWKGLNNIPPIAQICANLMFGKVFVWYGEFPDAVLSGFDIFFDRGDPYLSVLMQQWNNKRIRNRNPWWGLVRKIAPADMSKIPGLQAADMLAWSHNRLKANGPSGWAGRTAHDIATDVQSWNFDLTEDILAERKFPNEWGFYT